MGRFIDLTGQRFNRLTVINRAENSSGGKARWNCLCDCGNTSLVITDAIKSGKIKSCGCHRAQLASQRQFKDLMGHDFGKLTVIGRAKNDKIGRSKWLCKCRCGKEVIVRSTHLQSGNTQSCGCWKKELSIERFTTHGMRKTKVYRTWCKMIQRCYNPNIPDYKDYGMRGIEVCAKWKRSFENFLEDMGQPPTSKHSIDRIYNDGNYYPDNCRWATPKEQARHTRNNRLISYKGEVKCLSEWAELLNMNVGTLCARLNKSKWSVEKALTTSVNQGREKKQEMKGA